MKRIIVALVVAALAAGAGVARGAETSSIHFQLGAFSIDKTTCRFAYAEQDWPLGRDWMQGRMYVAYEDRRHDVLMNCLRARQDRIVACLTTLPPVTEKSDHGAGNPGDEKGAKAALDYLKACVAKAAL